MAKYQVYGVISGSKYLGEVEASSEEEAEEKGCELETCCVCLCHHCVRECQDAEIYKLEVELSE